MSGTAVVVVVVAGCCQVPWLGQNVSGTGLVLVVLQAVLEQGQAPFSRAKYNAEGQLVDTAAATAAAASVK